MNTDYSKISTGIPGLNDLFYGGMELSDQKRTLIIIKGGDRTEKTLLGLQLLYNLGLDLNRKLSYPYKPLFISTVHNRQFLEDLLLDVVIASCSRRMTVNWVQNKGSRNMAFTETFFNTDKIRGSLRNDGEIQKSNLPAESDTLICKDIIHYSNRTNALHIKTLSGDDDNDNMLYMRKYDSLGEYYRKDGSEVFDAVNASLGAQCIDISIRNVDPINILNSDNPLVAIEMDKDTQADYRLVKSLAESLKARTENNTSAATLPKGAAVLILDDGVRIPEDVADIVICLENTYPQGYMIQRMSVEKSNDQSSILGWHQYKRRDYGIEVYPSLHKIFQKRRYLQRALMYTHSSIISDTFQQYLEYSIKQKHTVLRYSGYESTEQYLKALSPHDVTEYTSDEILSRILLYKKANDTLGDGQIKTNNEILYGYRSGVTAIIGNPNTYKRFLTFGSMFSSAIRDEHTLILLLNKEDSVIRRRLSCPACLRRNESRKRCKACYEHIHFMNMCIGCITPDEFIYYLIQQIDTPFGDGKKIRRIIFDDLQIIDFCFPMLRESPLFLSALMSVCRERDIALYIMCDKAGEQLLALRSLADNVICTDRAEDGRPKLYVERFAGYNISPSKIYCGKIADVKRLFRCDMVYSDDSSSELKYTLNTDVIEDDPTATMDNFWNE